MDNHILLAAKRKEADDQVWRLEMMEQIIHQCSMEDINRLTEYLRFLRAERAFSVACKAYIESKPKPKEHDPDCEDCQAGEAWTAWDCLPNVGAIFAEYEDIQHEG